jgi:subtilisin family serine protease
MIVKTPLRVRRVSAALLLLFASGIQPPASTQLRNRAHGRWARVADGHDAAAQEVIFKLKRHLNKDERALLEYDMDADEIEQLGTGQLVRLHSRTLDADTLKALMRFRAAIDFVEPNYRVEAVATAADPYFAYLWGLRNLGQAINGTAGSSGADIHATNAWDVSTGSRANVVAVVDTGIDYTHPDLAANMWSAPSAFTVTIGGVPITCGAGTHGFNAITRTCDPKDDNDHGTHVAGTIGASGNNGAGVAGVNWTASIMALKFLDSTGSGSVADAVNAIDFAIQARNAFAATKGANVRILSNSWGGAGSSQALLDAINRANANDMLFVAAAGNSAANNDTASFYPAGYSAPNLIAVAATDNTDHLASFSNYGAASVNIAAPGVFILSTTIGNTYKYFSGTSMATPHVAGAAALVLSKCALTTSALKTTLLSNVDVIGGLAGWVQTSGRLNVDRALRSCFSVAAVPAAPAGLTATSGPNAGQISLAWSPSTGATSYKVKRSLYATGPFSTVVTLTKTNYVNIGLTTGKTYHYAVTALNASGQSVLSNVAGAVAK